VRSNRFLLSVGKASATNLQQDVPSVVSSIVRFFGTSTYRAADGRSFIFSLTKEPLFFFLQFILN
jgi:hypothetical protein